ncbi:pentatricopeptide repeat-containing protein At5g66520-like [Aristolochia californica]|uniref:pentatricopeptide repeat-containing protein At5g66520-like n=1 Tax=Aristolochia californica TaxID=171875 RepID=UPI0035D53549
MAALSCPPSLLPARNIVDRHYQNRDKKTPIWFPSAELLSRYPLLIHLCSCKTITDLSQIHAQTLVTGIFHSTSVASRLLSFAALSPEGSLPYACQVYDQIAKPDIFVTNTLLSAHASSSDPLKVVLFYIRILESSCLSPDRHTFPLVLKGCSRIPSLPIGRAIHAHVFKFGFSSQVRVLNFLVHMYSSCGSMESARLAFDAISEYDAASWSILLGGYLKCGSFDDACKVFDEMPERRVVSWSLMINAYMDDGCFKEALEMFTKMLDEGVEPNESVLVNVLSACAHLGAIDQGKWLHGYVTKYFVVNVRVGTALLDMYLKCGCVDEAVEVFDAMEEKNVLTWSAMIGGLAINGQGKSALDLFYRMENSGVKPNGVTFIGLLNACSHTGLVDEGLRYFDSMSKVYGLKPDIHHYCCMVDLYGRTGMLDKAEDIIRTMPVKPNAAVWGALLNACRISRNFELGEQVGKRLLDLEPNHSGRYVFLSNMYAAKGRWEDVAEMRKLMKERGVIKTPGCSFVDLRGAVHRFVAGDISHMQSQEIYDMLAEMTEKLIVAGYKPDTTQVLLDMDEEEKGTALSHHSEKLAIAFGLINSIPGGTIRIKKNLRVCDDCHEAAKLLSEIFDRKIVLRDRCRYHHFRNGFCSCGDFW